MYESHVDAGRSTPGPDAVTAADGRPFDSRSTHLTNITLSFGCEMTIDWSNGPMGYDLHLEHGFQGPPPIQGPMPGVGRDGRSTFRVNGTGMSFFSSIMEQIGMLDLDWQWPSGELSGWEYYGDLPDDHPDVVALAAAELKYGQGPLIPRGKLTYNSWQLVSPAEISSALAVYDANHFPDDEKWVIHEYGTGKPHDITELWTGWIQFLRDAVTHGGFRVA